MNTDVLSGIQNHDPSNQVATDLHLKPYGHQKQHIIPRTKQHKWIHRYQYVKFYFQAGSVLLEVDQYVHSLST